jgi:hypothetical protein
MKNKPTKFQEITSDELLEGTGVAIKFDNPTDEIVIIREGKRLVILPITKDYVNVSKGD